MQKEKSASEYEAWLSKFEAKKTTDDCYTPAAVYVAVKAWAAGKKADIEWTLSEREMDLIRELD